MTMVVVGGHSRKVGKTSVAAGIIAAFADHPWTAIKISSHWHGEPQSQDAFSIREEQDAAGQTDSSRFLAAGAARSFWVRVREGRMEEVVPRLLPILESSPFAIVESNGILPYVHPDIYIMTLRYDIADFKVSARETLDRAQAIIVVGDTSSPPAWMEFAEKKLVGIPLFSTPDPRVLPTGLLDLVRSKLTG